jgi:hypothetical protein
LADFNSFMQNMAQGDIGKTLISLLSSIDTRLETLVRHSEINLSKQQPPTMESILSQAQAAGAKIRISEQEPPKQSPENVLTEQPQERNIMRDSSGQPEIIRFPLPFGHGTVIYKKHPGPISPGGFTISVQGPDGLMRKYEEIPTNG